MTYACNQHVIEHLAQGVLISDCLQAQRRKTINERQTRQFTIIQSVSERKRRSALGMAGRGLYWPGFLWSSSGWAGTPRRTPRPPESSLENQAKSMQQNVDTLSQQVVGIRAVQYPQLRNDLQGVTDGLKRPPRVRSPRLAGRTRRSAMNIPRSSTVFSPLWLPKPMPTR